MSRRLLLALWCGLLPGVSRAGDLSGTVLDPSSAARAGQAVTLFEVTPKGPVPGPSTTTDAQGAFAFPAVADGTWRLLVQSTAASSTVVRTSWYAPDGGTNATDRPGDAADLVVTATSTQTGLVMTVPDGLVLEVPMVNDKGAPVVGVLARAWDTTDVGRWVDGTTGADGVLRLRGVAAGSWEVLLHHPAAAYAEVFLEGASAVTAGTVAPAVTLTAQAKADDPLEPNDFDGGQAAFIDQGPSAVDFRTSPPEVYTSPAGVFVGPPNDPADPDLDVYCWGVQPWDRYLIHVDAVFDTAGGPRAHPFVDPMMQVRDGLSPLAGGEVDDGGTTPLGAFFDTGLVGVTSTYCVWVTTAGDTDFDGVADGSGALGQESAGDYVVSVEMGNRAPVMVGRASSGYVFNDTYSASADAGGYLGLEFDCQDPESGRLTPTFSFTDWKGQPAGLAGSPEGAWTTTTLSTGETEWGWSPTSLAKEKAPYHLSARCGDGEFSDAIEIDIPINFMPIGWHWVQKERTPTCGATVATPTPEFSVINADDTFGAPLAYGFYVYETNDGWTPGALVTSSGPLSEGTDGYTRWTPTTSLAEDTRYLWQPEVCDWTTRCYVLPLCTLFVNAVPDVPVYSISLLTPTDGAVLRTLTPALTVSSSVENATAGDHVFLVAADTALSTVVFQETSPNTQLVVPATAGLAWDTTYYVAARLLDTAGTVQATSAVHAITLQDHAPLTPPSFGDPLPKLCDDVVRTTGYKTLLEGPIEVLGGESPDANSTMTVRVLRMDLPDTPRVFSDVWPVTNTPGTITLGTVGDGTYRFEAEADDTLGRHEETSCTLWVDVDGSVPEPVRILEPVEGSIATLDGIHAVVTGGMTAELEAGVPGAFVDYVWCLEEVDGEPCRSHETWTDAIVGDPSATTAIDTKTLWNGRPLSTGREVVLNVRARSHHGVFSDPATVQVLIVLPEPPPPQTGGVGGGSGGLDVAPPLSGPGGCGCTGGSGGAATWALGWVLVVAFRRRQGTRKGTSAEPSAVDS